VFPGIFPSNHLPDEKETTDMAKLITIYNKEGEPERHTRLNAVDLTRHGGYTWKPGQAISPVDRAPIPKEKDKNPLDDKTSEEDDTTSEDDDDANEEDALEALKAEAEELGVKVTAKSTENSLTKAIAKAKAAAAAE
jgi:hypothetical protein